MSKYIPIDFAPRVFSAWLKIFKTLTEEERSEILLGIAGYPEYEPKGVALWSFFKGELDRQFEKHKEYSQKQSERRKGKETADDHGQPRSTADDRGNPRSTIREKIEDRREKIEDNSSHSAEPSACVSSGIVSQIVDIYKEIAEGHFIQLRALTDKRKKAVKQFVEFLREQTKATEDDALLSEARSYFLRASSCDFLCGKNDSGWRADFDFLTNKNKAVFVLEGRYDNKDERTAEQKAHDDYWKIKPVHDWQAEQEAYIKAKREQEEKEGLHHAEAIQRYLNGERA